MTLVGSRRLVRNIGLGIYVVLITAFTAFAVVSFVAPLEAPVPVRWYLRLMTLVWLSALWSWFLAAWHFPLTGAGPNLAEFARGPMPANGVGLRAYRYARLAGWLLLAFAVLFVLGVVVGRGMYGAYVRPNTRVEPAASSIAVAFQHSAAAAHARGR